MPQGKKYTVRDTQTGKTVTFQWNQSNQPTDTDFEEVFRSAGLRDASFQPMTATASATRTTPFANAPKQTQPLGEFLQKGAAQIGLRLGGARRFAPLEQEEAKMVGMAAEILPAFTPLPKNLGTAARLGITGLLQAGGTGMRAGMEGASPQDIATQAALSGLFGAIGQAAFSTASAGVKGGVRLAIRGKEAGRQAVEQSLQDFGVAGATPTVGQATQLSRTDLAEAGFKFFPGGYGTFRKAAEQTNKKVGKFISQKAENFAGTSPFAETTGGVVQSGILGFVKRFRETGKKLEQQIGFYLPKDQRISVDNTASTLNRLAYPVPTSPNLSEAVANPTIGKIFGALRKDAKLQKGAVISPSGEPKIYLTFDDLRRLRSYVGDKLATPSIVSDIPRAELKQLYAALSTDLEQALAQTGNPRAIQAFRRANNYTRAGLERIEGVLSKLESQQIPERVFSAIEASSKQGTTVLSTLKKSLKPDEWNVVVGTVLDRLGKATPGTQNATGDLFSIDRFLTDWNKIHPKAKDVLFGGSKSQLRRDLDAIARASQTVKESAAYFANPSGTGRAYVLGGEVTGSITGLYFGSFTPLMAALTMNVGVYGASKLMTNPKFVRWLAQSTQIKPSGLSAHIGRLTGVAASSDEETREAIQEFLSGLSKQENNK